MREPCSKPLKRSCGSTRCRLSSLALLLYGAGTGRGRAGHFGDNHSVVLASASNERVSPARSVTLSRFAPHKAARWPVPSISRVLDCASAADVETGLSLRTRQKLIGRSKQHLTGAIALGRPDDRECQTSALHTRIFKLQPSGNHVPGRGDSPVPRQCVAR